MAQSRHLSTPDPEYAALLAQLPPSASIGEDIQAWRDLAQNVVLPALMKARGPLLPSDTEYRVSDHQVPVDGGSVTVRCVMPAKQGEVRDSAFPAMVWVHGGGFITGSLDTDDYLLRAISVELQIVTVNVGYRLAPEHPFPTGQDDCYAALKWVAENARLISASLAKGFILGGQSSGGNYVASLTHRARDDPFFEGRGLTGQLLQYSQVVHPDAVPDKYKPELLSMEENKDAPMLKRDDLLLYTRMAKADPFDPQFSPLLYPSHAGLPPLYIQVCGWDPVRDECLLYEKVLREAGVETKLDVYPGVPHVFAAVHPQLSQAVKHDRDFREGIRWLLQKTAQDTTIQ